MLRSSIFTILLVVPLAMGQLLSPEEAKKLNDRLQSFMPKIMQLVNVSHKLDEPMNNMIYSDPQLADLYASLGELECAGLDVVLGVPLFARFVNDSSLDFGGKSLCHMSCRGECHPVPRDRPVMPFTLYPFTCSCKASECDANGPKIRNKEEWKIPGSRVVCVEDDTCLCDRIMPSAKTKGYICNWIGNVKTAEIDFVLPPRLSFIRWCECCPTMYLPWPENTHPKPAGPPKAID